MKRFLTWLRGFRTVPDQAAVERPAPINDDQIARRVIERLSEDESLRGDLTDDAFKPIFDWVTSLVPVAARRAAPEPDPDEAGEELSQAARQLLRALAQVVASGDTSSLRDQLVPPVLTADEASRVQQAIPSGQLPDISVDERSAELVSALRAALMGKPE